MKKNFLKILLLCIAIFFLIAGPALNELVISYLSALFILYIIKTWDDRDKMDNLNQKLDELKEIIEKNTYNTVPCDSSDTEE